MKNIILFLVLSFSISFLIGQQPFRNHSIFFKILETGCQVRGHVKMINMDGELFALHLSNHNHQVDEPKDAKYVIDTSSLSKGSIVYNKNDTLFFEFDITDCENGNELYRIGKQKFELSNKQFFDELYAMLPKVLEIYEEHGIPVKHMDEELNFIVQLPNNANYIKSQSTYGKAKFDKRTNQLAFAHRMKKGVRFEYQVQFSITPIKERINHVKLAQPTSLVIWDNAQEDKILSSCMLTEDLFHKIMLPKTLVIPSTCQLRLLNRSRSLM